jgi:hypothetical protein
MARKVAEANLLKYVSILLERARIKCASSGMASPELYKVWVGALGDTHDQLNVLIRGLEQFPSDSGLWLLRIKLATAVNGDDLTTSIESLYLGAISAVSSGSMDDRALVWMSYIEWLCNGSIDEKSMIVDRAAHVEKRLKEAISPGELAFTGHEIKLVELYLNWAYSFGGVSKFRSCYDQLISSRQRNEHFYRLCIEVEERELPDLQHQEHATALESGSVVCSNTETVKRLRRLYEDLCSCDSHSSGILYSHKK